MFNDVVFLVILIVVLAIIWIALNINIYLRRKRARQIRSLNLAHYVTFVNNFKLAEEEEKKGNIKLAIIHFRKALENLEREENPDEIVLETIDEIKQRLAALE